MAGEGTYDPKKGGKFEPPYKGTVPKPGKPQTPPKPRKRSRNGR